MSTHNIKKKIRKQYRKSIIINTPFMKTSANLSLKGNATLNCIVL